MAEVGFAQFAIQTEGNGPIPTAIWYPTDAIRTDIIRGPFSFRGTENSAPKGAHILLY